MTGPSAHVQSAINNVPSPQRVSAPPVTAVTGIVACSLISTYYRSRSAKPVTITNITQKRALNVELLCKFVEDLHPVVQSTLQKNRIQERELN